MSKKPSSSKNSMYEERIKSCFSRKKLRLTESGPYELPYQKHLKPKIQSKKCAVLTKKETREKIQVSAEEPIKIPDQDEKKEISTNQENNIEASIIQSHQVEPPTDDLKTEPQKQIQSQDELVKNCNLDSLKTLICQKLNDCDFFSGEENIKNSSKRLLFMEYQNEELYINKSTEKARRKEKVIPKDIQNAFKNVKSPKNYFSINSRIASEDTYDCSDPSNYSKLTPPGLTPRSIDGPQSVPNRRSSFTYSNITPLDLSQGEEMNNNIYYPHQSFYYYGGFSSIPNMDYSSENSRSRTPYNQFKSYNIDVHNISNDGRTTLMIKNIPNKYTREMLIELFDRTHKKKYDFLYLPIDPDNSCNIGYAFINFLDCSQIKEFYEEFNGERWERFNSEKICRLSYARMQGTTSLAEHIEITTPKHRKIKNHEMNFSDLSTILEKQRKEK